MAIQPSNADVYVFIPVNRLMLYTYVNCTGCAVCKTNIHVALTRYLWYSRPYIAGANFIRSSVNLGISLYSLADLAPRACGVIFFTEFLEWNNYTERLLITKNTVLSIPTRYYSPVRTKRLLVLPYTGLTLQRI